MRGPEGASVQQCTGATRHPVRLLAQVHQQVAGLLSGPLPGRVQGDSEDAYAPAGLLDHGQDISLGTVEQVGREEVARQDHLGLGAQEQRPGRTRPPRRGVDPGLLQDFPHRRRRHFRPQAGQLAVDPAVAPSGFSRASRSASALMFRRVAGRPVLPRMDLAAQRRRTISRCQRRIVSGVTSMRSPWRRAFGITPSRAASNARSAQFSFGRRGCRRCRTASWWRRIKISAVCHASSRGTTAATRSSG